MRSRKAAAILFTVSAVLVPSMAITACGDDDDGTIGPPTLLDGSSDGRSNAEGSVPGPSDANNDTGRPFDAGRIPDSSREGGPDADAAISDAGSDADADAAMPDSGSDADAAVPDAGPDADASTLATVENGLYTITTWTCTPPAGTPKDIKSFIGQAPFEITAIDLDVAGSAGRTDVIYTGGCTRSSDLAIAATPPGTFRYTTAIAASCTVGCAANRCQPNARQFTDTFAVTKTATTFTGTRVMDADSVNGTIQSAAGCQVGDTETATYTKK